MSVTINGIKYSMNLYLVSVDTYSYDECDSAVVCTSNPREAIKLSKTLFHRGQGSVDVKCVGYSEVQTEPAIILSSFNAG